MVQIHLGPLNVSPGQAAVIPTSTPSRPPGWRRTQRKLKGVFLVLTVLDDSRGPQGSVVATVQLRNELVLPVWEQVAVKIVGRSDVRVPHAPHDLEGIGAPVDHERGGRVAHLMKREWFALRRDPRSQGCRRPDSPSEVVAAKKRAVWSGEHPLRIGVPRQLNHQGVAQKPPGSLTSVGRQRTFRRSGRQP
jgi:hypothetical protein